MSPICGKGLWCDRFASRSHVLIITRRAGPVCWKDDRLANEDFTGRRHCAPNILQDLDRFRVGPALNDVPEEVDVCVLDWLFFEKIMAQETGTVTTVNLGILSLQELKESRSYGSVFAFQALWPPHSERQ